MKESTIFIVSKNITNVATFMWLNGCSIKRNGNVIIFNKRIIVKVQLFLYLHISTPLNSYKSRIRIDEFRFLSYYINCIKLSIKSNDLSLQTV